MSRSMAEARAVSARTDPTAAEAHTLAVRYFGSYAPGEVLAAKARLYAHPRKLFRDYTPAETAQYDADRALCDRYEEWARPEYDREGCEIVKAPFS